ncbi:MAG TPA: hypothetical protein PKY77_18640 [Phycisphaerae bacterium]|nr:hypothetical protein [Phycisphaerae bacterium]HRY69144.1 hypothetical protein [Phycisphaerae bacterium]HSA26105.1 hypothetical protein [Phycisphaerae bacterium]
MEIRPCPKVNLQVVASNAAVVTFYRKLGYHVEEPVSMGKVLQTRGPYGIRREASKRQYAPMVGLLIRHR